ncbi:hypothetical protein PF008_g28975 [Phytophthora fragariae]|uniref:Ig-like domain-containing protein n=1 Tax=Phytophthora fragariae TaxID=53985 RepID=A0A6G0QAF8_9STRA|nr:hypothetical protein PF008_g28975 [Phytophthora fragariae]
MVIASIQVAVLTAALVAAAANAHSKMSLPKPTRSAVQHDSLYGTATIECGFSWTNGTARDLLPDEVQWDKLTTGHDGPCEIWCDETLVFSDQNCAVNYPDSPASFSYDKAACEGKSSSDSTTSTSTTTSAPTTSSTATTAPSPTTASPSSTEASSAADGSSEEASTAADYDTASAASEQTETTAASTSAETATSAETEAPQATTTTTGAKCSRRRS